MANIKSAKKRILVNSKKNEQNKMIKSKIKTVIKNLKAYASEDVKKAEEYLSVVFKTIDSAASKNILHANNASRKKAAAAKVVEKAKNKESK